MGYITLASGSTLTTNPAATEVSPSVTPSLIAQTSALSASYPSTLHPAVDPFALLPHAQQQPAIDLSFERTHWMALPAVQERDLLRAAEPPLSAMLGLSLLGLAMLRKRHGRRRSRYALVPVHQESNPASSASMRRRYLPA